MSNQHTVSTDALDTLGTIIDERAARDAIHLAVEPAIAGEAMRPGCPVQIVDGKAWAARSDAVGIVDPFLKVEVAEGQRFWLVVNPRTITSLRHVWSHPSFPDAAVLDPRSASKAWMMGWARQHMSDDYYGERGTLSDEEAYANALQAGHNMHVGPYESARDHIDATWWGHWQTITGALGEPGKYFSCAC